MHNWWIAALEHAGIWTREEAEHVADNIKNSIHKEKYSESYDELGRIISAGKFNKMPLIIRLETDVAEVKSKVADLSKPATKPATVAQKTKA